MSTGGMYLHEEVERNAAVEFLKVMNKKMGWKTSHIIDDLRDQWQA